MEFSVSNTCNYACVMCSGRFSSTIRSHREKLPPLPKAYGETFFADLREFLPHLQYAKFLGGEPFLAAESLRIWEIMIDDGHCVRSHVTTNGSQYNARVERIPMEFCISLDSITKRTFEKIRVNSSFEVVMENIKRFHAYARARNQSLTFPICLMRRNWHEFGEILLFADNLDCNSYVNVVSYPPNCSLYTLPLDELEPIVGSLEQQNERIVRELQAGQTRRASMMGVNNLTTWIEQLGALRRHVDRFKEPAGASKAAVVFTEVAPSFAAPPVKSVNLGSLRRLTPISSEWGLDRGRPIDRYYIENFLAHHADAIRGRVLEFEGNSYARTFGGDRVVPCDVLQQQSDLGQAATVADLASYEQLPSDTFDCIIMTQMLQLIYDVHTAIRVLHRILKPGGVLLATFPRISQTGDEKWFWNFTTLSAQQLFAEAFSPEDIHIQAFGNVLVATAFLYGLAVEELRQEELDYRAPGYELTIAVRADKPAA